MGPLLELQLSKMLQTSSKGLRKALGNPSSSKILEGSVGVIKTNLQRMSFKISVKPSQISTSRSQVTVTILNTIVISLATQISLPSMLSCLKIFQISQSASQSLKCLIKALEYLRKDSPNCFSPFLKQTRVYRRDMAGRVSVFG